MAHGVDLVFPCGDPNHCCLLPTIPFYVILVNWFLSPFSVTWPLVCLRLSPSKLPFLLGLPPQGHFVFRAPSFLRRSYRLNQTDIAF